MASRASPLVIIGASVRAAAQSMRRAGFKIFGIDLFADRDLQSIAPCLRLPLAEYPSGFLDLLQKAPRGPVMYTGGLENYPDLIDAIAAVRPLAGNGGDCLRMARDPFYLHEVLTERGLPPLDVTRERPTAGEWLWKPLGGSAGHGIEILVGRAEFPPNGYFQRFSPGAPHSAAFIADGGSPRLLGICRQIIGADWLSAPRFRYAGNIGPIRLPHAVVATIRAIAAAAVTACNLRGYFGFDFLLEGDRPLLCELNPRYPASVEVLERAVPGEIVGKAILYAPHRFCFPDVPFDESWADIPDVGEITEVGFPICTRFTTGPTADTVETRLRGIAEKTYDLLGCGQLARREEDLNSVEIDRAAAEGSQGTV